jgi:hypothetical protein
VDIAEREARGASWQLVTTLVENIGMIATTFVDNPVSRA